MIFNNVALVSLFLILFNIVSCVSFRSFSKQDRLPSSISQPSYDAYQASVASRQLMEQGRAAHNTRDYKIANRAFYKLLRNYPYTGYIEEASCLLAKGLYYEDKLEEGKLVITRLQEYDPNLRTECMGDALLILGRIHQKRGQIDSAISLYRKVITQFYDHAGLVDEAEDLLLSISL